MKVRLSTEGASIFDEKPQNLSVSYEYTIPVQPQHGSRRSREKAEGAALKLKDQHRQVVDETMATMYSDDDMSESKLKKRTKRDRLTFHMNNQMGVQMSTGRQKKTKKAEKVIGFEAFKKVSGRKQVSSLALASSLARKPSIMVDSPNSGSFKYEMGSNVPTILAPRRY